ncbi:hypothetical protein DTO027B5_4619 [Paecilomyces variotii]|nr:hypothetical protein DTO032I3_7996 [Paecilomyces variotii]KAJ9221866.1 hypothetical protein DTO169C6_5829 [Paecilomyces variotii]KAJ9259185.1 hypothetical protein DTO195F2_5002 [Paecilomyces variotii]KAJ9278228.1 hypothetical protein DTO021D3_4962 [Paecilomyces variotii]KAJ9288456.1 hypothetical protein DTO021C3_3975 [Paecilomyces variotii]
MSFKSKNLNYEAKEPPFLQRLKSQYGGANSGRHERAIPRPRRLQKDDDEDAPTYVDGETNEVISKEEYESLVQGDKNDGSKDETKEETASAPAEDEADTANPETKAQQKQNIAEIGGPKKRKQGRVVGEEDTAENAERRQESSSSRKPKQKKKKIKLSFDEGED